MRKSSYLEILPRVTLNEWKFIRSLTSAWSLRDIARKSRLPVSTVYRILHRFYKKGHVYFILDHRKVNLITLILILPCQSVKKAPPFTVSVRRIYNFGTYTLVTALIPPPLIEKYIDQFNVEPLITVRGYDYLRWSPLSELSTYDPVLRVIKPVFDFEKVRKHYNYLVEPWNRGLVAPDVYDLVLIQGRLRDPFARPVKIYREARRRDLSLLKVSEQVLSYHFNKHVKTMWKGNTAIVFNDVRIVPVRIFYFEGRDAPVFARILSQLPGFYAAIIDVKGSIVVGQPPYYYDEYIMRGAEGFDVEMPFSYFI